MASSNVLSVSVIVLIFVCTSASTPTGVEYPGLGCFTIDPPFNNTNWLPQRPSFINTAFFLYTRTNRVTPDTLRADDRSSIESSHFNGHLPVKILVHGFLQYGGSEFLINMTRALLDREPMNVIVVNWGGGAGFPYTQAVANTRLVGAEIARLINALSAARGVHARNVHVIGHSLGAHVAGYVGARVPGLGRITGLDPAQPNYSGFHTDVRLDSSDARYVDVIHTDAVPYNTVDGYGMMEPVGHADFYPNGGHHQPGCHDQTSLLSFMEEAISNGISDAEVSLSCSHERSTELFTASVNLHSSPCTFQSYPCQSEGDFVSGACLHCGNRPCPVMGLDADRFRSTGVFFLNTTGTPTYCGHHYFVKLIFDHSMIAAEGQVRVRLTGTISSSEWTPLPGEEISGGDAISVMILEQTDLGEIQALKIKFDSDNSYFSWSSDSISLQTVEVTSVMKFPTKHFCQSGMTVHDGQTLLVNSGTYDPTHCAQA